MWSFFFLSSVQDFSLSIWTSFCPMQYLLNQLKEQFKKSFRSNQFFFPHCFVSKQDFSVWLGSKTMEVSQDTSFGGGFDSRITLKGSPNVFLLSSFMQSQWCPHVFIKNNCGFCMWFYISNYCSTNVLEELYFKDFFAVWGFCKLSFSYS